MSTETDVQVEINEPAKRGRGRPRKNPVGEVTGITRENRIPVSGFRDILTVDGKDPEYHYRWVLDESEVGRRVFTRQRAGYTFATVEDGLQIGQSSVYKSDNIGSCIRVPNDDGRWLYLMKIPKDWHEDDLKAQSIEIDEKEASIKTPGLEGTYGEINLKHSR